MNGSLWSMCEFVNMICTILGHEHRRETKTLLLVFEVLFLLISIWVSIYPVNNIIYPCPHTAEPYLKFHNLTNKLSSAPESASCGNKILLGIWNSTTGAFFTLLFISASSKLAYEWSRKSSRL